MNRLDTLWFITTNIYQNIHEKQQTSLLGIHDLDHIRRVKRNCNILSEQLEDNVSLRFEALQAAAMFHDLGYCQITQAETDETNHIAYSLELCAQPMQQVGFSQDEIEQTQAIIATHHDKDHTNKSLEQKLLYLGDKLDMFGFDGTMRMIMRYAPSFQDRDKLIRKLLEDLSERVHNDLLQLGIGIEIIELRRAETYWLLQEIKQRSK